MDYQDQNNEIILTEEFYTGSDEAKVYYDPDNSELNVELQDSYASKLGEDCEVVRRDVGIYDFVVKFPVNYPDVIIYLTWKEGGLEKAKGYNVRTVYASGNLVITAQNISGLQLSQHLHENYGVLQEFSDIGGVLYYKGEPIEGGGATQVQSNWNETDTESPAHILNKPAIPTQYTDADAIAAVSPLIPENNNQLTNGAGYITISAVPTLLSQLGDDATHRLVTDAEKSAWSGKQDAGDYATNTALASGLATKENTFSKNSAFNKNFGMSSGEVCQGDDSRLSDSRTPTAHDLNGSAHNGITGTENNFMALDAGGKPKDSGSKASDFEPANANLFDISTDDLDDISDGAVYKKFSATEQSKLSGIETGAEVNTIDSNPSGVSGADQVINIMSLTTAEYAAISGSEDSSTLYVITDAT